MLRCGSATRATKLIAGVVGICVTTSTVGYVRLFNWCFYFSLSVFLVVVVVVVFALVLMFAL